MAITFRNVYHETADMRRSSAKRKKSRGAKARRKRQRVDETAEPVCAEDAARAQEAIEQQAQLESEMADAGLAGMFPLSFGSSKKIEARQLKAAVHVKFDDLGNETAVEHKPTVLEKRPRDEDDEDDDDDDNNAAADNNDVDGDGQAAAMAPTSTGMAADMDPSLEKYWAQRYALFTKFDEGIRLDHEGWFSVTPEVISEHHAMRLACDVVVDAFTGCGGNAIQLAKTCRHVIAIDMDPAKIAIARHNAGIYGVADRIEWLIGDAFALLPTLRADAVFLSPPWGGPEYLHAKHFALDTMRMGDRNGIDLFHLAETVSPNIAYFLPRNTCKKQARLLSPDAVCEFEHNFLNKKLKTVTLYFGDLATRPTTTRMTSPNLYDYRRL
ncbi:hypothetical protein SPRG_14793 [Saprolegnia parasitica CBS 223.65]|uniref:Trimethylguanosine synthase n=1 Tax=Saprolegnia parasitica (strain CBS 223.65) TaxID=695850 RepID=A0A067BY15_SAPPC|nr:hypothetical protein SPRG_14793 [Saprolegnia parasitica CBS 223.65]KDO19181.1 hypothetical protein SPRG_14793 [Saprolegnia parasitica CBS 223.65]|eukprot:XP_012210115.1 hypothetical protein SPRG_14793 [Saprolegnia parasitica CBS 223.65]